MLLAVLPACLLALAGCTDETQIFEIVDCGLERLDLTGTWCIGFEPDTADLFNCIDGITGDPTPPTVPTVTADPGPFEFNQIVVFAGGGNVGFRFEDSASSPHTVAGSVEADSCLMFLSFRDDEDIFLNCFGTFDIPTGVMAGGCDSAAVPAVPVTDPPVILEDCDLDPILGVTLTIGPCP